MSRKRTIPLLLVLFIASVLILPTIAGAATSSRTLPASVNVKAPFTVSISVADYGLAGVVIETIPDGFTYAGSSLDAAQAKESVNTVTFILLGESDFDYTLIASDNENTYTFSGIIKDVDENEYTVGGDTSIILVAETDDPITDEQTSTPTVQTTQVDPESVDSETIDETVESETSVDDVSDESSKSETTTESTEEIPASEATPFITTFGIIVIGIIATLVYKRKH